MIVYWDNLPNDTCKKMLQELIRRGLKYTNAPKLSEVSVSFVSKEVIKGLNVQYRGVDNITDVLSFPFCSPEEWQKNKGMPVVLGDIVICTDVAREQAELYGHSLKRELGFLTVHGLLHLVGYDHMQPEEEEQMRQAQRDILSDL